MPGGDGEEQEEGGQDERGDPRHVRGTDREIVGRQLDEIVQREDRQCHREDARPSAAEPGGEHHRAKEEGERQDAPHRECAGERHRDECRRHPDADEPVRQRSRARCWHVALRCRPLVRRRRTRMHRKRGPGKKGYAVGWRAGGGATGTVNVKVLPDPGSLSAVAISRSPHGNGRLADPPRSHAGEGDELTNAAVQAGDIIAPSHSCGVRTHTHDDDRPATSRQNGSAREP